MAAEKDTPTQVINIPGTRVPEMVELTVEAAQLFDDQERRALALERAAGAIYNASADHVIAAADYVITGRNPFDPRPPAAG